MFYAFNLFAKGLLLDTDYDDNLWFMINLGGGDIILCECFTLWSYNSD